MKKTLAAIAVTLAVVSAPASSFASMYYDRAMSYQTMEQRTQYVDRTIARLSRTANIYKGIIDKYPQFAHYAFMKNIIVRYNRYNSYITELQSAVDKSEVVEKPTKPAPITVTSTKFTKSTSTKSTVGTPTLLSEDTETVTETVDNTVSEYAVITRVYRTTTTTETFETTTMYRTYSNGTDKTVVGKPKSVSVTESYSDNTEVSRNLVREYALVVEPDPVEETVPDKPIVTVDVAELKSRSDVDYSGTQFYTDTVHNMNSRVNIDYITRESGLAPYASSLVDIGAPEAWSRGYTGKDSTIAILDTGIDLDHSEFTGRITATKCFTRRCEDGYETVQDKNRYSHGTHVAGIAAASLDGAGSTGVAPDADLLIGKVAYDSGYYSMQSMTEGVAWAVNNGADAINISGNVNVDRTYSKNMHSMGEGFYVLKHDRYESNGYGTMGYNNMMSTGNLDVRTKLKQATNGSESVLVMSAGNQRLPYATFPAHYAVSTDENGDLEFGGKIIVAGNWDVRTNRLASSSNGAGTVCMDFDTGKTTCNSQYKISDFYLMAPGQYVASTDKDGGYVTRSGTSMSAPTITGAVAVVHQMWPHMKGENLVKLLLTTGDKDLQGYDVNIHGQGLLDLDAATQPQGAIGIPTTGRAEGARVSVSGGIALNGGATISALQEVMVVDDYDRDYYIDANEMTASVDTRTANPVIAAQNGVVPNYYAGYVNGQYIPMQNASVSISEDGESFNIASEYEGFTFGIMNEADTFLGNFAQGELMDVNGATTTYAGYQFDDGTLFGGAQLGTTHLNVGDSYMKSADTLVSYNATLGVKQTTGATTFGFVTSLPTTIASGSATFNMPSSVSASGDIINSDTTSSLRTPKQEVDYGIFMNHNITNAVSVDTFVELRTNYAGTDRDTAQAGINFKVTF